MKTTRPIHRFRTWDFRYVYGTVICCLTGYTLFYHIFVPGGTSFPEHRMTSMTMIGDNLISVRPSENFVPQYEGWMWNTTSGLLDLAGLFDGKGEAEIALAIYRKLLDNVTLDSELSIAITHANRAFQIQPRREPYYRVAKYFDEQNHNASAALHYYRLAASTPKVPLDAPFREANVYAVDIERDILWLKVFPYEYLQELQSYQNILDDAMVEEDVHSQAHDDMVLMSRSLFSTGYEELFRKEGPFRPNNTANEYYYSTPTIVRLQPNRSDDFIIVCRLINYRIDPAHRGYQDYLPPGGEPHFLKSALALHRGIKDEDGILLNIINDALETSTSDVIGPEDPRILRVHYPSRPDDTGEIMLIMTSWEYPSIAGEGSRMASGTLDPERGVLEVSHAFASPHNREWEKNWVMFEIPGDHVAPPHYVYEWYPLKIGTLVDEASHLIDFHTRIDTPRSFKFLRGSTNGVARQQEIWFMVHGVGKKGYTYYHKIVVLDARTLHVRRHSYPFKLEGLHTEFCLGMDIDEQSETMTIAYSVLDGSSVLRRIALWKVEALMVA